MFPTPNRLKTLQEMLGDDLITFAPELVICAGIIALLIARLIPKFDRSHLGVFAVVFLVAALFPPFNKLVSMLGQDSTFYAGSFFQGMLVSDQFAVAVRFLVLIAALLTVLLTLFTGIPDTRDSADFYTLILGATLGMMLMSSVNHLLMLLIAVEMASLPSYAMAGFLKGKRTGSEASLKYVIYGAGASGVMLYGITLLSGTFGTGYLPNISEAIARRGLDLPVLTGLGFLLIGLGFKLAAVPFHFWCPDVFEGAAAEVAGFLSVASKSAAVALTARVLLTLQDRQLANAHPWAVPEKLGLLVGVIAAITITFGNLAAFGQTNLKRLLAYSTIAHAGYMLLGVATVSTSGASSILYYLVAYIVMNLGAFAVVALVRNATRSEDLSAYRGLVQRSPVLAVTMTVFLLALLGLPPLAGFAGKFQVFAAVYEFGKGAASAGHTNLGTGFYILLAIGAVNAAMSAYYYLRVVRAMLLDSPDVQQIPQNENSSPGFEIRVSPPATLYLIVLTIALFAAGIVWNPITKVSDRAAESLMKR